MLAKLIRNVRLNPTVKECKFAFNRLSKEEKAYGLLLAVEWLCGVESAYLIHTKILNSPKNYKSEQCYKVYKDIASTRPYLEKGIKRQEIINKQWGDEDEPARPAHCNMLRIALLFWLMRMASFVDHKNKAESIQIIGSYVHDIDISNLDTASEKYNKVLRLMKSINQNCETIDIVVLNIRAREILYDIRSEYL